MSEIVFHMRSRLGNATYLLRPGEIEIYAGYRNQKFEAVHQLRNIAPGFETEKQSLRRVWQIFLMLTLGCFYLMVQLAISESAWGLLVTWPLMFGVLLGWQTVRYIPKAERVTFHDHSGNAMFSIIRESTQFDECTDFLEQIKKYIGYAERRQKPPPVPVSTSTSVRYGDQEPNINPHGQLWVYSLLVAPVCLCSWLFGLVAPEYRGALFVPCFLSAVSVFLMVITSFTRREKGRFWSLIGVGAVIYTIISAGSSLR